MSRAALLHGHVTVIKCPELVAHKAVDTQPPAHGTLSPELREYLMEKRRALLTELKALNRLLGLKTE